MKNFMIVTVSAIMPLGGVLAGDSMAFRPNFRKFANGANPCGNRRGARPVGAPKRNFQRKRLRPDGRIF